MKQFRVGLSSQILHSRVSPTALARADMLTAAASGIDSWWVADHLNVLYPQALVTPVHLGVARINPTIDAQLEPWTMLGHLASRRRFGRLRLGIGVTDASRRHPAVTAQAAATLNLITRGRAILGIGVGMRAGNTPYGVDWAEPVARFEEAVATIRALWNSAGDLVSRESRFFPLHDDPSYPSERTAQMLTSAAARLVLTDNHKLSRPPRSTISVRSLRCAP